MTSDNQHELNQTNSSDLTLEQLRELREGRAAHHKHNLTQCTTCNHYRIHHPGETYCATTTVTGPATENHSERTETRCDCTQFTTEETK